jgi:hypothetical protein
MLLQGVPPFLRPHVWMHGSGAAIKRASLGREHFDGSTVAALSCADQRHIKQIDLDVGRTFPEHPFFRKEEGLAKLRTVLIAYAGHNPDIGYCQSMNYIAGLLILVMDRDPEDAFWVLVTLLDGVLDLLLDLLGQMHF